MEDTLWPIETLYPEDYPSKLREIPEPPERLYIRGRLPPPDTKLLAVVGSRALTPYGRDACEHLLAGLADYNICIVSGMAIGIDAVAHRAALKHGLPTIALPGSGLDDAALYPRSHAPLAHEILRAGGALLSEFEPHEKGHLHFFPARNRIMAGMSDAVLVVEAGVKSGTLITARLASDYGRELLVVPHSIFSDGGAGGHIFMKLGAQPVRSASDILEALGIVEHSRMETVRLSSEEQDVLVALKTPLTRDELIRELGLTAREANVLLGTMELRGLIAESLGEIRKLL